MTTPTPKNKVKGHNDETTIHFDRNKGMHHQKKDSQVSRQQLLSQDTENDASINDQPINLNFQQDTQSKNTKKNELNGEVNNFYNDQQVYQHGRQITVTNHDIDVQIPNSQKQKMEDKRGQDLQNMVFNGEVEDIDREQPVKIEQPLLLEASPMDVSKIPSMKKVKSILHAIKFTKDLERNMEENKKKEELDFSSEKSDEDETPEEEVDQCCDHILHWVPEEVIEKNLYLQMHEKSMESLQEKLKKQGIKLGSDGKDKFSPFKRQGFLKDIQLNDPQDFTNQNEGQPQASIDDRQHQIIHQQHNEETFKQNYIMKYGLNNVYGNPVSYCSDQNILTIDNTVLFHQVESMQFIILAGFQQGALIKTDKGKSYYAQGNGQIKIYQIIENKREIIMKNIHQSNMNNQNYKYLNYKNYNPVIMHRDCVYWIEFDNDFIKQNITVKLMKYDLADPANIDKPAIVKSFQKEMKIKDFSKFNANKLDQGQKGSGDLLIGATAMFAENQPEISENLSEDEFLKRQVVTLYFRQKEISENDSCFNNSGESRRMHDESEKKNSQSPRSDIYSIWSGSKNKKGKKLSQSPSKTQEQVKRESANDLLIPGKRTSSTLAPEVKNKNNQSSFWSNCYLNNLSKIIKQQQQQGRPHFTDLQEQKDRQLWVRIKGENQGHPINILQQLSKQVLKPQMSRYIKKPFYFYERNNQKKWEKKKWAGLEQYDDLYELFNFESTRADDYCDDEEDDQLKPNIPNRLDCILIIFEKEKNQIKVIVMNNNVISLRIYTDNRVQLFDELNFKQEHIFTQYAIKERFGQQLCTQYENIFINNNGEDDAVLFFDMESKKWAQGKDHIGNIWTPDVKEHYFNYDYINGMKKTQITRVEVTKDNQFLRLRIVGGEGNKQDGSNKKLADMKGLYLQITEIKRSVEINQQDVTETNQVQLLKIVRSNFDFKKYYASSICWSSPQYSYQTHQASQNLKVKDRNECDHQRIYQNMQWCQISETGHHANIFEYRISWIQQKVHFKVKSIKQLKAELLGIKIVLFDIPIVAEKNQNQRNMFYPMYDNETGQIIGTQWLGSGKWMGQYDQNQPVEKERTKVEDESFYKLLNIKDKDYMFKTTLVKSLYRTYESKKNPMKRFTLVQAYCGEKLLENFDKFSDYQVQEILTNELNQVLNMVPTDIKELTSLCVQFKIEEYDFLQPLEILGRQSICDFFLQEPELIKKYTNQVEQQKKFVKKSILQSFLQKIENRVLSPHDKEFEFFKQNGILRDYLEIYLDMFGQSPLRRCFDFNFQNIHHNHHGNKAPVRSRNSFQKMIYGSSFRKLINSSMYSQGHSHSSHYQNKSEFVGINASTNLSQKGMRYETTLKAKAIESSKDKNNAKLTLSAQYLTSFLLNKEQMTQQEYNIFMINIKRLINSSIHVSPFFETMETDRQDYSSTQYKKKFAMLIENKEFPETLEDKSVIRTLGRKHNLIFDQNTNESFINYYFKSWHNEFYQEGGYKKQQKYHGTNYFFHGKSFIGNKNDKIKKVENFIIDWSAYEITKKKWLLLKGQNIDYEFNLYQLAKMIKAINSKYSMSIEKHDCLKKIIEAMFQRTQENFMYQIIVYFFGYICPQFMQIFHFDNISIHGKPVDDKVMNMACNTVAFFTCCGFFVLECIQFDAKRIKISTYGIRRLTILFWFPLQLMYFILRIIYPGLAFPILYEGQNQYNFNFRFLNVILNWLLIFISMQKACYFMQVTVKFRPMIELLDKTMFKIKEFLLFFGFMCFIQASFYKVLGIDIYDPDEGELEYTIWAYCRNVFRNSVGDLITPTLPFMNEEYSDITKNYPWLIYILTMMIWLTWVYNIIILFIVLCNFLIAYISQSYEEVLEMQTESEYRQMCELNEDHYLLQNQIQSFSQNFKFIKKHRSFNIFMLTSTKIEDKDITFGDNNQQHSEHTSLGIIKKIKQAINSQQKQLQLSMDDIKKSIKGESFQDINNQISQINEKMEVNKTYIGKVKTEIQSEIQSVQKENKTEMSNLQKQMIVMISMMKEIKIEVQTPRLKRDLRNVKPQFREDFENIMSQDEIKEGQVFSQDQIKVIQDQEMSDNEQIDFNENSEIQMRSDKGTEYSISQAPTHEGRKQISAHLNPLKEHQKNSAGHKNASNLNFNQNEESEQNTESDIGRSMEMSSIKKGADAGYHQNFNFQLKVAPIELSQSVNFKMQQKQKDILKKIDVNTSVKISKVDTFDFLSPRDPGKNGEIKKGIDMINFDDDKMEVREESSEQPSLQQTSQQLQESVSERFNQLESIEQPKFENFIDEMANIVEQASEMQEGNASPMFYQAEQAPVEKQPTGIDLIQGLNDSIPQISDPSEKQSIQETLRQFEKLKEKIEPQEQQIRMSQQLSPHFQHVSIGYEQLEGFNDFVKHQQADFVAEKEASSDIKNHPKMKQRSLESLQKFQHNKLDQNQKQNSNRKTYSPKRAKQQKAIKKEEQAYEEMKKINNEIVVREQISDQENMSLEDFSKLEMTNKSPSVMNINKAVTQKIQFNSPVMTKNISALTEPPKRDKNVQEPPKEVIKEEILNFHPQKNSYREQRGIDMIKEDESIAMRDEGSSEQQSIAEGEQY